MSMADRARIEAAVVRYDFWLDLYGTPGRRRRDLRRELRANLTDAVAEVGYRHASSSVGSTRALAAASAGDALDGPRWAVGAYAALATLALMLWTSMVAVLSFADGVEAAGVTGREVQAPLSALPGAVASYERSADGLAAGLSGSWPLALVPLAVLAAVLVVAARPWRLAVSRPGSTKVPIP